MSDQVIAQNIVDRAAPELDEFLARFYRQIGLYAVAVELGQPTDDIWADVETTLVDSTQTLSDAA
jgi:hypothetical protein